VRLGVAAELILSESARGALEKAPDDVRDLLEDALDEIETDHDWGARPARYVAPAKSRHVGHIVDLSVPGWAIVYRPVDKGAHVEVRAIERVFVG
jgi:hypothetical protein